MLKYFAVFLSLIFILIITPPLFAGTTEDLEKKLIQLQEEYQKKFDELKNQIDEIKINSTEQKIMQQQQIEEIQKATKEKEDANKKELETMQAKMEEQKKLALQAGYDKGFFIKSADDQFLLKLNGYLQTDLRFFEGGENRTAQPDTFDIRRARLIVGGNLYKYFEYKTEIELNAGAKSILTDGFLNVNYTPLVNFQVGQFKKPIGYEGPQLSDSSTDFITKAIAVENIVGTPDARDIGIMLKGALFSKTLAYYIAMLNGTGANNTNDSHDFTFAGRLVASPFKNTDIFFLKGLNFGGSLATGNRQLHKSADISLAGRTKPFKSISVNVDGQRFIAGPELVWYVGPFGLKSEYYFQNEERNDIPERDKAGVLLARHQMKDLKTKGYYISALYMLTGEDMSDNVIPKNNFNPLNGGGLGAWEVVARLEGLSVNKDGGNEDVLAGENVLRNKVSTFTLGLNWYLNPSVKLMLNWSYNKFSRQENLKDTSIGGSENILLTRFQFKF